MQEDELLLLRSLCAELRVKQNWRHLRGASGVNSDQEWMSTSAFKRCVSCSGWLKKVYGIMDSASEMLCLAQLTDCTVAKIR